MTDVDVAQMLQHPAWVALQKRLRDESILFAACVSEGFCPRCRGRLVSSELPDRDGFCRACDLAWTVGPRGEDGGHSWASMSGWYYRECIQRRAQSVHTSGQATRRDKPCR